jgi:hypothetical protein
MFFLECSPVVYHFVYHGGVASLPCWGSYLKVSVALQSVLWWCWYSFWATIPQCLHEITTVAYSCQSCSMIGFWFADSYWWYAHANWYTAYFLPNKRRGNMISSLIIVSCPPVSFFFLVVWVNSFASWKLNDSTVVGGWTWVFLQRVRVYIQRIVSPIYEYP